jgi:hypothetical protein
MKYYEEILVLNDSHLLMVDFQLAYANLIVVEKWCSLEIFRTF